MSRKKALVCLCLFSVVALLGSELSGCDDAAVLEQTGQTLGALLGAPAPGGDPQIAGLDPNELLELDGNIVHGADPGCSMEAGTVPEPFYNAEGHGLADWEDLFELDPAGPPAPHGRVLGPVSTLPPGGLIAAFFADQLSVSGLTDCSTFGPTSNKNGDPIGDWRFQPGQVPAKDDLSNVMAYLAEDGQGNDILYLALERYAENGDSHVDFEINQDDIQLVVDTPGTTCPGSGHFEGTRLLNDLLVAVDFERGGGLALVRIRPSFRRPMRKPSSRNG